MFVGGGHLQDKYISDNDLNRVKQLFRRSNNPKYRKYAHMIENNDWDIRQGLETLLKKHNIGFTLITPYHQEETEQQKETYNRLVKAQYS